MSYSTVHQAAKPSELRPGIYRVRMEIWNLDSFVRLQTFRMVLGQLEWKIGRSSHSAVDLKYGERTAAPVLEEQTVVGM